MFLEKAYTVNDKNSEWGTILFHTIDEGVHITNLPVDSFSPCAMICYNDGDIAWDGNLEDVLCKYEELEHLESNEIEGIPKREDEVYVAEGENCEIHVIKKNCIKEYFGL